RLCARLGVPHATLEWTGDKPATGVQARARAARYRLLADEAALIDADFIVTGHTLEDQAETLAMRRARDPEADEGMDEAVLVERRIWVVRPFLAVTRGAIRDYLRAHGLSWSEDPSNDNPAFERVRVRLAGIGWLSVADAERARPLPYADAARFVRDRVRLHGRLVAAVDLDGFQPDGPAHRIALLTLVAMFGGREHLPGKAAAARIFAALATGADVRLTAGRVVFDRRKNMLYLCREARGLPDATIPPGSTMCWDGRFEIGNDGAAPVRVAAGRVFERLAPLLPPPEEKALPGAVARLVSATMPRLVSGPAALRVRPVLAPFEHFLPLRKLALADGLATVFGLEQFPVPSLGEARFDAL
ncbi:MAG TPA: tRNA lysidine(34) synthetase TilS, partial [Rhizobiales bacterium]|nr:tRNA lysidine(34) synthetase TilS [Hyphomicrobiales bacterium]